MIVNCEEKSHENEKVTARWWLVHEHSQLVALAEDQNQNFLVEIGKTDHLVGLPSLYQEKQKMVLEPYVKKSIIAAF